MQHQPQTIIKSMSDDYAQKNLAIMDDFDRYLAEHFEFHEMIPYDCVLAMTSANDRDFSKRSIAIGKKHSEGRAVVSVQKRGLSWKLEIIEPQKYKGRRPFKYVTS